MKIGYPCINNSISGTSNGTFRLKSYSQDRLIEVVEKNLEALMAILQFNIEHDLLFFRIGSSIIPFASHPVCDLNWSKHFERKLKNLGDFIKKHNIRISMHPDQFVVINSLSADIVQRSVAELEYQCKFLDSLGLESDAKLQIHVGGMYGDKQASMIRFVENYKLLSENLRKRLVIENDDRLYSVQDCLYIHEATGIPIIFDNLHFDCLNNQENMLDAFKLTASTWKKNDGIPMIDYSTQEPDARVGNHTKTINEQHFEEFLKLTKDFDFDIMLEIKDKELSALKAHKVMKSLNLL
jgi:UV DNA damage endonuclease